MAREGQYLRRLRQFGEHLEPGAGTMKAAIVRELGASPVYGEFEEPMPKEGEVRVSVTASALTNLTRGRASGAHYSSAAKLPFIPGIDGVGRLDNGQRVYFIMPRSPFGVMGERTVVDADRSVPVPDEMGSPGRKQLSAGAA